MGHAIGVAAGVFLAALAFLNTTSAPGERGVYRPQDYGITGSAGCVLPSTPPHFTGVAIPAASPEEAESAAARLGFAGYWEGDLFVCPLNEQAIVWVAGPRHPSDVRLVPRVPQPLAHRVYEPADPALPLGLWPVNRRMHTVGRTPNGSARLRSVIAIVPSSDSVAKVWPPPRSGRDEVPLLSFGPPVLLEPFSAWSRVAGAGGWSGTVTLLEPDSDDGLAARWLTGGARWVGVELTVTSVDATAAWFAEHGVDAWPLDDLAIWVDAGQDRDFVIVFRQLSRT